MIDINIADEHWLAANLEAIAGKACDATLKQFGLDPGSFEISVLGCDDTRIAELNQEFRGKPLATNVLSWPSTDRAASEPGRDPEPPKKTLAGMPEELGDIAIAYDTCAREAAEAGRSMEFHTTHLMVHATLHLLGYDHIDDQDAVLMETKEREILATLGFSDPYGSSSGTWA